jgi:nitrite reductase/ring-hydroxylating ferredoxin subunit
VLTKERNDFYCQVGKGTPMGEAMRRFWWPVLLSEELPTSDSDPVLVRLLGERFVAFRDSDGQVGILDEYCCHRGASLVLGRVEGCGIECIYHGWRYAVDGRLLKAPKVASEKIFEQIRQPAYPVRESGGLIWTYIGRSDQEPPFRRMLWMDLPPSQRSVSASILPFNYLAMVENQVDSAHVSLLHRDSLAEVAEFEEGRELTMSQSEGPPELDIEETDFGFYYTSFQSDDAGVPAARVNAFVLPTTVMISPGFCTINVPLDDFTLIPFTVSYSTTGDVIQRPPMWESLPWLSEQAPGRLIAKTKEAEENRYLQDRSSMRRDSYAGFPAKLAQEDSAILLSMGSYPTRAMEHLVPYDKFVIALRKRLTLLAGQGAEGDVLPSAAADVSRVSDHLGQVDQQGDWRYLVAEAEHA